MKKNSYILWSPPEALDGERPLPVKVRNKEYEVVAEGLTGHQIPIPAGSYWVTATLLDGREVGPAKRMKTMSDPDAAPVTAPADIFGDVPAGLEMAPMVGAEPMVAMAPDTAADLSAYSVDPQLADCQMQGMMWTGDWWALWDRPFPTLTVATVETLSDKTPTRIRRDPKVDQMLAISDGGTTSSFGVVPFDICLSCVGGEDDPAILATLEHLPHGVTVRFRSDLCEKTNTLLSFIEAGIVKDMQSLSADIVGAEEALLQSGASILRAVAAGYVMLRSNDVTGLEAWLDRLEDKGDMVPDINTLRLELCARLGHHEEAIEALDRAISGRCPWFRSGISYAFDRLRLYIEVSDNRKLAFALTKERRARFAKAFRQLEHALRCLDVNRHIATFNLPGAHPDSSWQAY